MKNLALISLLMISNCLFSQEYVPFNFEKGIWINELQGQENNTISQYFCKGDTTINEVLYHKLYEFNIIYPKLGPIDTIPVSYKCAIRNSNNRQVVAILKGDTNESILYDFNLNIGDTIINGGNIRVNDMIVTDIDSTLICDSYHRRFQSQYYLSGEKISLVEGVGINNCLFGIASLPGGEYISTGCYIENNNPKCDVCNKILSNKTYNEFEKSIVFYPNPVRTVLNIESQYYINKIEIYNLQGKSLLIDSFNSNKISIDISSFKGGIYIAKILLKNNDSYFNLIQKI